MVTQLSPFLRLINLKTQNKIEKPPVFFHTKIMINVKREHFTVLYFRGLPLKNIWRHLIFTI